MSFSTEKQMSSIYNIFIPVNLLDQMVLTEVSKTVGPLFRSIYIYELCVTTCLMVQYLSRESTKSFITLIPKKNDASIINDFRPIFLRKYTFQILTKLLANTLQVVILQLVYTNQYGFIKQRSIHDYESWNFENIHDCHKSK